MSIVQDQLCRYRRGYFIQLLALAVILAATESDALQHVGTVLGCSECPKDHYFNIDTQSCHQCTKCLGPLVELTPCAYEVPDYCDLLGQFDRLCCHEYEYEAYGECVLDCTKCEVTGRCKKGLTECDCPPDRYGNLCQFAISSSSTILEADPAIQMSATSTLLFDVTTSPYLASPTPTPLIGQVD